MRENFGGISIDSQNHFCFFDWASASPLSVTARNAMRAYVSDLCAATDMPDFIKHRTEGLFRVRQVLSLLVGASTPNEIVLVRSASEAINTLASGLNWNAEDEVVVSKLDHPANIIPWRLAAHAHHLRIHVVEHDRFGIVDLEHLKHLLSHRTRLVTLPHVSYLYGTIQPIHDVTRLVREMSHALLSIDGAQAVGRIPVDVKSMDCDFFVGSGRKALLAPIGAAFFYGKGEHLATLRPLLFTTRNWASLDTESIGQHTWPRSLEGNLPDMAVMYALEASVEKFCETGLLQVHMEIAKLSKYLVERFGTLSHVALVADYDPAIQSGIHSFKVEHQKISATKLESTMRKENLIVAAAEWLRISLHVFNTFEDIDKLAKHLEMEFTLCDNNAT